MLGTDLGCQFQVNTSQGVFETEYHRNDMDDSDSSDDKEKERQRRTVVEQVVVQQDGTVNSGISVSRVPMATK